MHCDSTDMPIQPESVALTANVFPKTGGETGWDEMQAAYDDFDQTTRARNAAPAGDDPPRDRTCPSHVTEPRIMYHARLAGSAATEFAPSA